MLTPTLPQRLLHERDAAQILGVSASTLRRWRSLRRGPPYVRVGGKPGGAIRYREADLLAWLASNTVSATMGGDNGRARR